MVYDTRGVGATGEISVMGSEGDTKHFWNEKKWEEVEAAKAVFDLYLAKKFKAYRMNVKGDQGEPMGEFDPSAGAILFVPALAGG